MLVKVKAGKPHPGYMSTSYSDFDTFEGTIIPNPKWVHDDSICLSTGDEFFPMRVIKKSAIVSMDENAYISDYTEQAKPQTFKIAGSKGDVYCVTADKGVWTCDCKGFSFRKDCRHVGEAKKLQNG